MTQIVNSQSSIDNRRADLLRRFRPMPMPPEVVEVLAPRRKQHMLDWMQQHYVLPEKSSRIRGAWQLSVTPFWRPVIEWLCDLVTRVIWVFAGTQTGKSTIFGAWMGYVIDVDPGPMKIVLPDEKVVKKRIKRLKPAFENSPRILRHLGGDIRNLLIGEPTDLDNMQLILAWPTSPITLSDDPARYVGGDEVALWPRDVKDDTDPISLLSNRTRTYETVSKQFYVTSPKNKNDLADINFESCQKWAIHIPCPECGAFHEAAFEHVQIDKDAEGNFLPAGEYKLRRKGQRRHAAYVCPHCHSRWSELERKAAISSCRACPEGCTIGADGEIVGDWQDASHKAIRIPSVLVDPMFTTVEQLAADWVTANKHKKAGNYLPLRNFWNNQNARAWERRERATDLAELRRHAGEYAMAARLVPRRVQMICHGIDVQTDCVWVVTKGYGFRNEQWLLWAGRLETGHTGKAENWDLVEAYVRSEWVSAADEQVRYTAARAAVDCRYQRDEESTVVYDFCLRFPEGAVIPVMGYGRDRMRAAYYKARAVAGKALHQFDLNVDAAKDRFWQSLYDKDREPGPGYLHLPADLPEPLARQLASETQSIKRARNGREIVTWELKPGFRENHLLDANNYCDLAAELAGVFHLHDLDYVQQFKGRIRPAPRTGERPQNDYWANIPELRL